MPLTELDLTVSVKTIDKQSIIRADRYRIGSL
jgi:hypothetical protein